MDDNLNLKTIETVDTSPFRKLVMTIGELPTSFVESMTYYELLAWFTNYLQTVIIPTVNNNGEAVKELQDKFIPLVDAFNQLKTYVETYFDNLDVQEEINNKLDEMVEDGTLQELINEFLQSNVAWEFDTVADMKLATNLINGSYAHTLGFTSIGDGGGAYYKISDSGTPNEMDVIELQNSLFANYVSMAKICTPQQFGAVANGNTDCTLNIQAAVNSGNKVYFPVGTYKITDSIILDRYAEIELAGDGGLVGAVNNKVATIVSYTTDPAFRIIGECVKINGGIVKARECTLNGTIMVDLSDEETRTTNQMNDIEINTAIYKWKTYAGGINDGSVGLCVYFGAVSSNNSGSGMKVGGTIRDFDYGIKSHKDITTNAWFTGMWHSGFIVNCCRAISLEKSLGGSYLYGQYQSLNDNNMPSWAYNYGTIYIKDTSYIMITGFVWDWSRAMHSNKFPVYCAGVCNQIIYTRSGDVGYEAKSYRRDIFENNFIHEKDYPYGALSSNNENDLLAFANLKYLTNVIAPVETIASETSPNYWLNALDRSLIKNSALFMPADGVAETDNIEYGYEIYFDKGHQIREIGFELENYLYSPLSVSIYVYYNNEWKLNTTIPCNFDSTSTQTVHGATATNINVVYFERTTGYGEVWRNRETEIEGIRVVFEGFSNTENGTKIRAVWARELVPSSIAGEKLAINGGKTYGSYLFPTNPILVDDTTGDTYTLDVNNGTLGVTQVITDDPQKFILSTHDINISQGETKTLTVQLRSMPTGPSQLTLTSNKVKISVSPSTIDFNAGNWNTPQTITIAATADASASAKITVKSGTIDTQVVNANLV